MTSTNSLNKGATETTAPRTPRVGNTGALDDATWRQRVEDDNTFLRNQVATISNAMELLLARIPQTMAEQPHMPRRDGAWVSDGQTTFVPPPRDLQNPFMQRPSASPNQPGTHIQAGAHNPGAPFQASSSQQSQPGATDGGIINTNPSFTFGVNADTNPPFNQ